MADQKKKGKGQKAKAKDLAPRDSEQVKGGVGGERPPVEKPPVQKMVYP